MRDRQMFTSPFNTFNIRSHESGVVDFFIYGWKTFVCVKILYLELFLIFLEQVILICQEVKSIIKRFYRKMLKFAIDN